jgi:hypothetical protein
MSMQTMAIVVVPFFCSAGVLFMIWVLYHFVLESAQKKRYQKSPGPLAAPERPRSDPDVVVLISTTPPWQPGSEHCTSASGWMAGERSNRTDGEGSAGVAGELVVRH